MIPPKKNESDFIANERREREAQKAIQAQMQQNVHLRMSLIEGRKNRVCIIAGQVLCTDQGKLLNLASPRTELIDQIVSIATEIEERVDKTIMAAETQANDGEAQ